MTPPELPAWLARLDFDLTAITVHAAVTLRCTDDGQHNSTKLARALRVSVTPGIDPRHSLPGWLGGGTAWQLLRAADVPVWHVIPPERADPRRPPGMTFRGHDDPTRHTEPTLTKPVSNAIEGDTVPHQSWRLYCRRCRRDVPTSGDRLWLLLDAAESLGGTVDVSLLP